MVTHVATMLVEVPARVCWVTQPRLMENIIPPPGQVPVDVALQVRPLPGVIVAPPRAQSFIFYASK
jgi:hypothetical protein